MANVTPGSAAWLDLVVEPIVEQERPIVDPHHHLWRRPEFGSYLLPELWADTGSGHNIEKTVFVECRASYRDSGPDHLKPVGETEFVAAIAAESKRRKGHAVIAGIVAHADLTRSDVEDVLDAHEDAGKGLFRGIRHSGAHDPHRGALTIPGRAPAGLYEDAAFRKGVALLGRRGLTYDTWHYHHQNGTYAALARVTPGTTMILDHFGTPLGVGPYADRREAIFAQWKTDIAEIARCPNVVAKLGGLAMPDNGFGWDKRQKPATSDELVEAQRSYYLHTIDCFGPERCMFESNFPVDKHSLSYAVLWNALKKIAAGFSESEKHAMFYGTAARVYRL
jgi:predicted TIM-barrel fold metal-dependent hydrolase